MALMEYLLNLNEDSSFIKYEEIASYYKKVFGYISNDSEQKLLSFIKLLDEKNLLPIFYSKKEKFFLKGDLDEILPLFNYNYDKCQSLEFLKQYCIDKNILSFIAISQNTLVSIDREKINSVNPAYYSAIRNLINYANKIGKDEKTFLKEVPYFGSNTVISSSKKIVDFIDYQIKNIEKINQNKERSFANSAYYMGSKKNLGAFLVEAVSRSLTKDGVLIDLMCGSGAASQAFNTFWPIYSSDAQLFCQRLALIQGKGYTYKRAKIILRKIISLARENAKRLDEYFGEWVKKESIFFHSNVDPKLFNDYLNFKKETACYPVYETLEGERLYNEVLKRKKNNKLAPYCLFSTYFANVYFGLRQSIEIDSIRYAIDQLGNLIDQEWATGALIVAMSVLGSTYAAHFAQPKELNLKHLPELLDQRSKSILNEFSIRFMALARESENAEHKINILEGPWGKTLLEAEEFLQNKKVLTYLDAPYKREEYSRYYHVLETVVLYNYPEAKNKGKLPNKEKGERFRSVFFTQKHDRTEDELIKIICSILERKWICAWSYSDNGDANIMNVINHVHDVKKCKIISYSVPYTHKSQGKRKPKVVKEYCIIFMPNS